MPVMMPAPGNGHGHLNLATSIRSLRLRNGLSQTWVQNGAAPSVVSEAPLDGGYYVRHMGMWVQIETVPDVLTAPISNGTY